MYRQVENGLVKTQEVEERIERLDSIGFTWNLQLASWEDQFQELTQFKKDHGHCDIPRSNRKLGRWVNTQRLMYRRRAMTAEVKKRIEKLQLKQ